MENPKYKKNTEIIYDSGIWGIIVSNKDGLFLVMDQDGGEKLISESRIKTVIKFG